MFLDFYCTYSSYMTRSLLAISWTLVQLAQTLTTVPPSCLWRASWSLTLPVLLWSKFPQLKGQPVSGLEFWALFVNPELQSFWFGALAVVCLPLWYGNGCSGTYQTLPQKDQPHLVMLVNPGWPPYLVSTWQSSALLVRFLCSSFRVGCCATWVTLTQCLSSY